MAKIQLVLNGTATTLEIDEERTLLWVLREDLGLTGAKYGCGEGQCGACTVLVDGEAVRSCTRTVGSVDGKEVLTIEGLASGDTLHPLQAAFVDHDAMQCGFCTPGMILGAVGLLARSPHPTREEIVRGLDTHLCRCGAHPRILKAVEAAAEKRGE